MQDNVFECFSLFGTNKFKEQINHNILGSPIMLVKYWCSGYYLHGENLTSICCNKILQVTMTDLIFECNVIYLFSWESLFHQIYVISCYLWLNWWHKHMFNETTYEYLIPTKRVVSPKYVAWPWLHLYLFANHSEAQKFDMTVLFAQTISLIWYLV